MRIARRRSGFTLVELVIVSALIAVLSSIAVFSIQTFYNQNVRKATLADLRQLATAMEFANQDLSFYPKLCYLNDPKSLIMFDQVAGLPSNTAIISSLDYYGYYDLNRSSIIVSRVESKWTGPYGGWSVNRGRSARGGLSGLIKVRVADLWANPATQPYSIVSWPADNYGHPFAFYQMKLNVDNTGAYVPTYVTQPGATDIWLNAVVSYGPNKLPGGNLNLGPSDPFRALLNRADQFVPDDNLSGQGAVAFTLKGTDPSLAGGNYYLLPVTVGQLHDLEDSLSVKWSQPSPNATTGVVGMLDEGSDDMMIEF